MGLKVAMVSTFFARCGIATYSEALSKALGEAGCEVYGVRVPRFGRKYPEIVQDIVERIPVNDVDLIHVQHEYGIWQNHEPVFYKMLAQLGKPIVTTMHAIGNYQVDSLVSAGSDRVVVHNEFCARKFPYPTVIIPHGCNPVECPPMEECKKGYGIHLDAFIVGYCGFISPYKGLETLIDASTKLKNIGLLIAGGWHTASGDTEYIAKVKKHSLEVLEGRCQWIGYVPDDRLSTAYGAMNIVVYPSVWATESGALLTAVSHGKAVVASNVAPFREKEKVYALMTFKNVDDLARKIKRLMKDERLRSKLEEGARNYAEVNSWNEVAKRHIALYEQVLNGK
jgi:glycosyltransferase involved in cell wall biosynthesis